MAAFGFVKKYSYYLVFFVSLLSMLGSLYFSEVMKFTPCLLCWYQRIAMYPIVLISFLGALLKDTKASIYMIALSVIGTVIALYHNLMYYKIIPQTISPCEIGASCFEKYINWFGFITIPLLSLLAFVFIDFVLLLKLLSKNENKENE